LALIYIKILDRRLYAKNLNTGAVFDEASVVAMRGNATGPRAVIAVGEAANLLTISDDVRKHSPFEDHPRVILDDFEAGSALFKSAIKKVAGRSFFAPRVIIHVDRTPPGGVSVIERKALMELAQSAGARDVKILLPDAVAQSALSQDALEESLKKAFG